MSLSDTGGLDLKKCGLGSPQPVAHRHHVRMSPTVRPPDGVTLREQVAEEAAAVHETVAEAFGESLVADLDAALAQRRGKAFVAASAEGVVGHVRLTWGWLDAPSRLIDVLILSPLSVVPAWQRRGVGRALVGRAVEGATELLAPLLILEGDPAYYSGSGFEPAAAHGVTRPSVRIPEPALQLLRLPGYQTWMTGAVVYPDTFWEFDCVGLRDASDDDVLDRPGLSVLDRGTR